MFKEEAIHERREFRKELYTKIFTITGKPKKILDLGCGLHPIDFPYHNIEYIAIDRDSEAIRKVKKYFKKYKIVGKAEAKNIMQLSEEEYEEEVDITFLLKVLDKIEKKPNKSSN